MPFSTDQLAPLRSFGYTEVESSFLYLVATHSGYFTVRQFLDFAHAKSGKRNAQLIEKLFSEGHATSQRYRRRSCVYHLHSRALYDAIDKGELRNRRNHEIRHIRARLLAFDYILAHPEDDYFETAEAKRRYFVETLKVPEGIFTQGTDQPDAQCETSRSAPVLVTRASETRSDEIRISRPVARVSGWSVEHTSRRARRPTLVGLQLRQHELQRSTLVLLAQRWASEGDKNGSVGQGVADASGVERCVAGMEVAKRIQRTWVFRFPVSSPQREEAAGPCRRTEKKVQPAFAKVGITGVGWHTFRHTVGTMLAEMGEHQLTIRDYLRHSNLHVTNKYLQATSQSKRLAQGKLVDAILPGGVLSASKSTLIQ